MIGFIIVFLLLTIFALAMAIISLKQRWKGTALAFFAFAVFFGFIAVAAITTTKNTPWEKESYTYLQEIAEDVYVIQGDNEYVYRIKNPDKSTAVVENVALGEHTEVEIKYLEDPEEVPYLEVYKRYENYNLLTKYVFHIHKVE